MGKFVGRVGMINGAPINVDEFGLNYHMLGNAAATKAADAAPTLRAALRDFSTNDVARSGISVSVTSLVQSATETGAAETAVAEHRASVATDTIHRGGVALETRHIITDPRELILTPPARDIDHGKHFDGYARHGARSDVQTDRIAAPHGETHDEGILNVAVGGTVSGVIDTTGDEDTITVSLVAGQTYSVYLYGSGANGITDSFLQVYAPDGTTLINEDDDGGVGLYSLITFTAATTGTYNLVAASFDNVGDPGTGDWTIAVHQQGADEAPSGLPTTAVAQIGHNYGFISPAGTDVDVYSITLTAGMIYSFEVAGGADYNTDYQAVPAGEIDTIISVYNSAGTLVFTNDDIDFPDDISSGGGFVPEDGGTYYVKVDGYSGQAGGYVLDITETDLADLDPLDAIDWGGPANVVDNSDPILIYFATIGETYDGITDLGGWTPYLQQQALAAFQTYSQFTNLSFAITTNSAEADFHLVTTTSTEYLAYFNPPGETNAGVGVFAVNGSGWDPTGLTGSMEPGGYGWITFIHEFGHGLGMAHPHDNGGGSEIIPGVTGPFGSYGIFNLNQGVYTTMSYNDGWQLHPGVDSNGFPVPDTLDYGYQATPMALDIAMMQLKYGTVAHNTGDDVYLLGNDNVAGTYYQSIWDTGGTDEIAYIGTDNVTIDLTAATLDYSATGAGVISWVEGIFGGYTIANGVVIENATGGDGDDVLVGNSAANILTGNDGNDSFVGRGGDDEIHGDGGVNTVVLSGNEADYVITAIAGGFTIEDTNTADGDEGTDTVYDITYLQFADGTVNLQDAPGNQAPTLDDLATDVTFDEQDVNAGPQLIDNDVTFEDSDGNFDGGGIQVTGALAEDIIGIRNQGTLAGQIGTSGANVTYGGVVIGQYSGGIGGTLAITLNGAATTLAVEALLENLTYANDSDSPTADRTLSINVFDDEGANLAGSVFTPGPYVELTGANDPLAGLPTLGAGPALAFVDVNNDGDLDVVVGDIDGSLRYFENNGAGYTEVTGGANPFGTFAGPEIDGTGPGSVYSSPATIDIDGDGDLDLVVGNNYGYFGTVQNNGDGTWTQLTDAANPLDGIANIYFSDPTAIDYDGDGDMDIVSGSSYGDTYAIRNDGGGSWTLLTGGARPFAGASFDVGSFSSFASGDVDGDGDDDLVVGNATGVIRTFINNGGGSFAEATGVNNPFNGIDVGTYSIPVLVDIDGDGDADLVVSDNVGGDTRVWENTSTTTGGSAPSINVHVTSQNDAPAGTNNSKSIVENSSFTFAAVDFGFSDAAEGDDLAGVVISTLPTNGTLTLNSVAVTAGQFVDVNDIISGLLVFTPDADENGANYASFTFAVRDNGGTADGGVDTDPTPNSFSFAVTPDNTAPTLTGVDSPVTFLENTVNAAPQLLDADVVFSDAEDNFDGGTVTVTGLLAEDSIGVRNEGNGAGQIGVSGANVSFGGIVIGTISGGNAGADLTITLNAAADTQAVEALIQNLTYANSSDNPTATRDLVINVTDDEGLSLAAGSSFVEHSGVENPFDGFVTDGAGSIPTFVDADGDGDMDLVVGSQYGGLQVFSNDGAGVFTELTGASNPFDGFSVGASGTYSAPAAIDVDGDGDLDLVVGSNYGDLAVLTNDGGGSWSNGGFIAGAAVYAFSTPTAVDLDGDGLQDIVVGSLTGFLYGFHNNGDGTFTELTGGSDPFLSVVVEYFAAPGFVDIDGDGDMDAVVGDYYGGVTVFTNDGGVFSEAVDQPFSGYSFSSIPSFTFYDVDGDGDLDGVAGSFDGDLRVFENQSSAGATITVDVTAESDGATAPTGTDANVAVTRGTTHFMTLAEFGFSDVDGNNFESVTITTLPSVGKLVYRPVGGPAVDVTAGMVISAEDIAAGWLVYKNANGKTSFTFQVHDDGASNNIDLSPNTLNLRMANAAPTGANSTAELTLGTIHTVTAAEFGFSDLDGNGFLSVTITTLPTAGRLFLNGVKIQAGAVIALADINGGKLTYQSQTVTPAGTNASFTFQVHDNGGTANGGIDTDQSPNTVTYHLNAAGQPAAAEGGHGEIARGSFVDSQAAARDEAAVHDFGEAGARGASLHFLESQSASTHFAVVADLLGNPGHDLGSIIDTMIWDQALPSVAVSTHDTDAMQLGIEEVQHLTLIAERVGIFDHAL